MSVKMLKGFTRSVNIASELSEEQLNKIGQQVLLGFNEDERSNAEWLGDIKMIEELASLKSAKKNQPLPNSANIKLPLITKACYEYASRVHPELVKDDKIVKPRILGREKDEFKKLQAQRACEYMNYQLILKNSIWQQQVIKLLVRLALIGFICQKTYYDPVRKQLKYVICKPEELIINAEAPSLEEAPRISHVLHWRLNDLVEYSNSVENDVPVFLKEPVQALVDQFRDDSLNREIDGIEQCTYLDLDEDGYAEPYIVTVLKSSGKVFRIVAQFEEEDIYSKGKDEVCYINKEEVYEDFHFLPNPKGSFQSVGFGILLLHLNESSNSIMNALIDAGQLSNMKGGYMDARLKMINTGNSLHDPGEFKLVKVMAGATLKEGILPIQYGEPSSVLHQLLGLLLDVARDLTASAEINNGTQSSENAKTGATLALQAEGKKISSSINKSFYTSLNKFFKHVFRINAKYGDQDEYMEILDDPMANIKKDFDLKKIDIMPVADPNLASDQQKYAEAAAIQQLMALPGIDPIKATKLILQRVNIPGIDSILADEKTTQQPNIELLKFQAETEGHAQELNIRGHELELKEKDLLIKAHLAEAQIAKMKADAILDFAKAESLKTNDTLKDYQLQLDAIDTKIQAGMGFAQMQHQQGMQQTDQAHQQDLAAQQRQHEAEQNAAAQSAEPTDQAQGPGGVSSESDNSSPA